jgi:hypothetical protein
VRRNRGIILYPACFGFKGYAEYSAAVLFSFLSLCLVSGVEPAHMENLDHTPGIKPVVDPVKWKAYCLFD